MKELKLYVDYGRNDTRVTDDKNNVLGTFTGNIPSVAESLYKLSKKKGYELYVDVRALGQALYDYLTCNYSNLKIYKCK
jgi:hypothetical protein